MVEKTKKISKTNNELTKDQKSKGVKKHSESKLEFSLVLCMLISLTILIVLLILLPLLVNNSNDQKGLNNQKEFIDYCKWVLTALLAAFGAWIGAGAAYFFGKENLRLSSESTQQALEIQKDSIKTRFEFALVKDINLTPFDPNFKFSFDMDVKKVLEKLGENVDYWFVPVIEKDKLKDTVHTEAFWRYHKDQYEKDKQKNKKEPKVKDVIEYIETSKKLEPKRKKLHEFFIEVKMDDLVREVSNKMDQQDASVGVVCDNESKPTHCFSKKDLRSFLLGSS